MKHMLLSLLCIVCTSCVSYPKDISIVSMSFYTDNSKNENPIEKIKVVFSSSDDLFNLASEIGGLISADAYFCEIPSEVVNISSPFIKLLNHKGEIFLYETDWRVKDQYEKRMIPESTKRNKNQIYYMNYDLSIESRDVCFFVESRNILNIGFRSNIVTVDGAVISNLINSRVSGTDTLRGEQ
ncbi:hypothetical protein [Grimontia sp. NTOU-MAR1]|uniref:hypothetical protein n=1 Tax=Grimontia sp. NTOU-MAR1 TaxID=3111011 RepID=UPI002DB96C20|nr:hypothetical protein [Grimontia sp. NTOU-MAR1]WRV97723.1 hypothetical protein VP504_17075 [Grimontia sp. NTOU-MAR1]